MNAFIKKRTQFTTRRLSRRSKRSMGNQRLTVNDIFLYTRVTRFDSVEVVRKSNPEEDFKKQLAA